MDLETLKLFQHGKALLPADKLGELEELLGTTTQSIEDRLAGLEAEEELAVLLHWLDCCTSIAAIEQGINSVIGQSRAADLMCRFKGNMGPVFLEVKTTKKAEYKSSENDWTLRKQFARDFGLPLVIALKIRGQWCFVDAEDYETAGRKISPDTSHIQRFNHATGNKFILLPAGLELTRTYARDQVGLGIQNNKHGSMTTWTLRYDQASLLLSDAADNRKILAMLFSFVEDSPFFEGITHTNGGNTKITHIVKMPTVVNYYHIFSSLIRRTQRGTSDTFSFSQYLMSWRRGEQNRLFDTQTIDVAIAHLRGEGFPFLVGS